MKSTFRPLSFASLLLGATLSFASLSPAAAQSSQVTAPPSKPVAITCSASLKLCGCKGGKDCSILKDFAAAGGCSNPPRCAGDICVCDLDALVKGDSPVLTAARQQKLVKPNPLDKITAPTRPVRDCKATATCGNTTVSCSVKGDGACQGVNGSGVSCTEFLSNGGQTTTTSPCGG